MNFLDDIKNYVPFNEQEKIDKALIIDFLSKNSNSLTRENSLAHLSVSSWIVNQNHDKVLLIFHNIYNSWSWAGGHADGDTKLLEVAIREAKEETGIRFFKALSNDIFSIESLCVNGHVKNNKYVSSHLHLNVTYLLEADDREKLKIKEDENKQVAWFFIEDALKMPNEEWMVKNIYKKLNTKFQEFLIKL